MVDVFAQRFAQRRRLRDEDQRARPVRWARTTARPSNCTCSKAAQWKSLGEAKLDPDAWVATFRIPNWDEKRATPYKLVYREKHTRRHRNARRMDRHDQGRIPSAARCGMAAMTCQNDYAFPYEPVANNLLKLDPDLLYFSGDQIYENHGGFGIIRDPAEPAILNYLRKFYQFGWAFREVMRDRPTLCLPDDHDVFQGNIWGEGGAKMDVKTAAPPPTAATANRRKWSTSCIAPMSRIIPTPSIRRRACRTSASTTATWSMAASASPSSPTASGRAGRSASRPAAAGPTT